MKLFATAAAILLASRSGEAAEPKLRANMMKAFSEQFAADTFRCGAGHDDKTCASGGYPGYCCSSAGYCGQTDAYCGDGCQKYVGPCHTTHTPSQDVARCGINFGNATCAQFGFPDYCCSEYGYCGTTDDYCGAGCQEHFGYCTNNVQSSEADEKKLRANMMKALEESESKKTPKMPSESAVTSPARERISQYVRDGQMFFIIKDQMILYEDPSKDPVSISYVEWFCQPTTAPDLNGDGQYDSVISHVVTFRTPSSFKAVKDAGATVMGVFTTHGYTASWVKEGQYYNERFVDFGDTTVWQIHGNEFIGYETSPPGATSGLVSSGEGTWTFNTTEPTLQALATSMGIELTPETCAETYAKTWKSSHQSEE